MYMYTYSGNVVVSSNAKLFKGFTHVRGLLFFRHL